MKQVKIIHTGDIHYRPDEREKVFASLDTLYETGKKELIDLWAIAGDLFEHPVQNTANSGLPELQKRIQKMMNLAPVVAVRGTSTHDAEGCYDIFVETNAEHSFTLLDPHKEYYLRSSEVYEYPAVKPDGIDDLLILGCPEPSKEWFLADKRMGRDEANEAIKDGMRNMLLGFGAIRKQYPDIPCLFVGHLNISGATMANGQQVRQNEITIGRDDLAMVGASYYALGHIHLAQQIGHPSDIGMMAAYYCGSAYPVNWGETEQKRFNLAGLGDNNGLVGIDFPHPPRMKIEIRYPRGAFLSGKCEGYQTWLEIKATKEESALINPGLFLTKLIEEGGALEGSRVTVKILSSETVRAGEIQEAKGLLKKLEIHAENSGNRLTSGIMTKADLLETRARDAGVVIEGAYYRLKSASIRGAIGIRKGLGLDEITIDFDDYDPGLIALIGANGEGKTTLIDNLQMFPCMPTRPGKLQDHFELRDSHRDLLYINDLNGVTYRVYFQIDGQNKSGKCEYHLYKNDPDKKREPLTNGRKEDYEQKIDGLFGSLSLFLRSAFSTQRPSKTNPDISEATKGEKKALFRELGGLDYLQVYAETAKENAKTVEEAMLTDEGKILALGEILADKEELGHRRKHDEGNAEMVRMAVKDTEVKGEKLKVEVEQLREQVEKQQQIQHGIMAAEESFGVLKQEAYNKNKAIENYEEALVGKPEAEKIVVEYDELKAKEAKLNEEKARVLEERERLTTEYQHTKDAAEIEYRKIEERESTFFNTIKTHQHGKEVLLIEVNNTQQRLDEKVKCPKCGNKFSLGQAEDEERLLKLQEEVFEMDKVLVELETRPKPDYPKIPIPPELPEWNNERFADIQAELESIDIEDSYNVIKDANEAQVRIEEAQKRLAQIAEDQVKLTATLRELNGQRDLSIENDRRLKQNELTELREQFTDYTAHLAAMEAGIKAIDDQLEEMGKRECDLIVIKKAVKTKQVDANEWRYLEKACGPDGIQALELDAMGPGIAEVANRLLDAAYGARFRIEFRTTRIGGSGKNTKQIEDFQIWILDSEKGDEQLLETLSGGESVWVKRAIYDAFAIVRDRNTGQRFLTVFQDEADGALDPAARRAYFRMIEAVHNESERHHTIIITHSTEAQEMIKQKIEMSELQAAVPAGEV